MSAFLESGRSDARKWAESKGRFRPQAEVAARKIDAASVRQQPKYWLAILKTLFNVRILKSKVPQKLALVKIS